MGIYTNAAFSDYSSSDYTSVEPFKGDHFNYHELGIIAAAESAANQNAFMKAIALQELASMEQYGNTDVLYESVNLKGIFEKIKAFFKKIIEKIHKIFHTFVAKMSSWFGNNKSFAQKYEKEVVKNWSKVSNDWEFKGYKFTNIFKTKGDAIGKKETVKTAVEKGVGATSTAITTVTNAITSAEFKDVITYLKGGAEVDKAKKTEIENAISAIRDKKEDFEEIMRGAIADEFNTDNLTGILSDKMDSKDFTEALFKLFRNGEDSKVDLKKSESIACYGGSINAMMTFVKDYEKIKSELEKTEKAVVKGIDDVVKALDKNENELIKDNRTSTDDAAIGLNEVIVQVSSLCQSALGFAKETAIQAFSAELQATKDACAQAKEIAVKVIGLNKKMTESADYSDDGYTTSTAFGGDFISSVKLV
jgi:hypothetical protein